MLRLTQKWCYPNCPSIWKRRKAGHQLPSALPRSRFLGSFGLSDPCPQSSLRCAALGFDLPQLPIHFPPQRKRQTRFNIGNPL
mgnify:CR=1 FL=1